jgi:hypothetical protein
MHTTVTGKQAAVGEAPRGPKHRSNRLEIDIVSLRVAPLFRAILSPAALPFADRQA